MPRTIRYPSAVPPGVKFTVVPVDDVDAKDKPVAKAGEVQGLAPVPVAVITGLHPVVLVTVILAVSDATACGLNRI